MTQNSKLLVIAIFCSLVSLFSPQARSQESFDLHVASKPSLQSSAELSGNRLTIRSGGSSYVYVRLAKMDSADGKYAAFFSLKARQYVRFPVSGSGKMFIGTAKGLSIDWRESQMIVQKKGGTIPTFPSGTSSTLGNTGTGSLIPGTTGKPLDARLAQVDYPDGTVVVAHVDSQGAIQMVRGKGKSWKPLLVSTKIKLVPNAPIGLVFTKLDAPPAVVSVDPKGRLVEVINGNQLNVLSKTGDPTFVPGSRVTISQRKAYLCGQQGRLWQYDPQLSSFLAIEKRTNLVAPGAPITIMDQQLFVIDRTGNLVSYNQSGTTWLSPELVKSGFQSGGIIGHWSSGGLVSTDKALVSVDRTGRPVFLTYANNSWRPETIGKLTLSPGTPIGISNRKGSFWVSFVDGKGNWVSLSRNSGGLVASWVPQTISAGFLGGGPVVIDRTGNHVFSMNRTGQLIAAQLDQGRWNCFACNAALRLAPRLKQREIVPNPPIPAVEIVLRNNHKETLVVRVFDRRDRKKKYDLKLAPNSASKIKIERDSGAVANELVTIVGPRGGGLQESRIRQIPPQSLYDVVVFEHKVTSQFFDRTKNKSSKPDSVQKSLVSVGVFPIPAGSEMTSGSQVSVYASAKSQKNPGAAARFGPIKQ